METSTDQPVQPPPPKRPVVEFLSRYLAMAQRGELQAVVLGYISSEGGAAVQSTPMSPVMMNHISKLLGRRVDREYDKAIAQAAGQGSGTGARSVPDKARPEHTLPRKVRRKLEQQARNVQNLAAKRVKKKQAAEQTIRAPVAPGQNGVAK